MKRINGKLIAEPGVTQGQNSTSPSFRGYQVELLFDVDIVSQTDPNQTYRISQTSDFFCGDDGVFVLEFEESLEFVDGVARIIVSAPNGARLSDQSYPISDLDVSVGPQGSDDLSGQIGITVRPVTITRDPSSPSPVNLTRGQIIQYCGQSLAENTPIIFWGCSEAETPIVASNPEDDEVISDTTYEPSHAHPANDPNCLVLITAKARADGTFSVQTPVGSYRNGWIQWGQRADQYAEVTLLDDGTWPPSITLVEAVNLTEKGEDGHQDCSCAGTPIARLPSASDLAEDDGTYSSDLGIGGCQVQFKPNRTLEEFAFCSFVRTTAPTIAREKIGISDLQGLKVQLNNFTKDFTVRLAKLERMPELFIELKEISSIEDQPAPTS